MSQDERDSGLNNGVAVAGSGEIVNGWDRLSIELRARHGEHLDTYLRMMRAMESRARNNGWGCLVSDTTDNIASANNFIRAGYRLYEPQNPWAWPNTLYWRKSIK